MQITKMRVNTSLVITPSGRLDTLSAGGLEEECANIPEGTTEVILDFALLKYLSSAGLRVIVKTKKDLDQRSIRFSIRNSQKGVMEVFRMTNFDEVIDIS